MRTAIQAAKLVKSFLEAAQPLPVMYAYDKRVAGVEAFVTYQLTGSPVVRRGIGNQIISERVSYLVTVQTKTARENMIYSEMLKLATDGTSIQYVSEAPTTNPSVEGKVQNSIILYLFGEISTEKVFPTYTAAQVTAELARISQNYDAAAEKFGVDISTQLQEAADVVIPEGDYSYEALVELKKQYLDRLISEEALISNPVNTRTAIQRAELIRLFLETVQPLKVEYGYAKGIKKSRGAISYQDMGSTNVRNGIGNQLISERSTFLVTVQTKTAQENMFYTELIKLGTEKSDIEWLSDSMRKDPTMEAGYMNSIILRVYNNLHTTKALYTAEEVRAMMQEIADYYIFATSIYREDASQSFIDKLTIPELGERFYSIEEFLAIKQEYLDKVLYTTTRY